MYLEERFYNLISAYTKDSMVKDSLWAEIVKHYSEPHRAYHNLTHISELFTYFDYYKEHITQPNITAFSIFYHDIIYNIWKKNNEEKSALLAIEKLGQLKLDASELDIINEQIIATKNHVTIQNDTKWMIDFDLGILGKSPETYANYSKLIRQEYKLVPSLLYKKGRKKVLQHFIDKYFIYETEAFRNLYERQAKINLTNELTTL